MILTEEEAKFLTDAKLVLKGIDEEAKVALVTSPEFRKKATELANKYGMEELFKHITYLEVKQCL